MSTFFPRVSVVNGSDEVTLLDSITTGNIEVGHLFVAENLPLISYWVDQVAPGGDTTKFVLSGNFGGATNADLQGQITRDFTPDGLPLVQTGDLYPNAVINEAMRMIDIKLAASEATAEWGGITGTLSDQTDLQNALDAKADASAALPSGGTAGQVLAKNTDDDFDVEWVAGASSPAWGDITGTLSDQTDLQDALNSKLEDVDWGDIGGTLNNQTDLQNTRLATLTFVIDGGGAAISTGVKGDLEIPFACEIEAVTLLADQSGSIVVDIWKDAYANYPPTDADSITASAPPTISAATKSTDATLTGWTTSIAAGDILRFNVDSAATIERVTISLKVRKS